MLHYEQKMAMGGDEAIAEAGRFFMREDSVHQSLRRITARLTELQIPHAVVGGMALVAHGYDRTTVDVDILVTKAGLTEAHERLEGLGYQQPFEGSTQLRDTRTGVRIEFLVTGGYPGDGKPKPVCFPNPSDVSVEIDGVRYIRLPDLVALKLASGMTNPGRLRDLADVQELIRNLKLDAHFAERLNPYVRDRFLELWRALREDATD